MAVFNKVHPLNMKRFSVLYNPLGPNVSTTPIMAMECRQCLSLSVFQLKGKHFRKLHCRNEVVDTLGLGPFILRTQLRDPHFTQNYVHFQ